MNAEEMVTSDDWLEFKMPKYPHASHAAFTYVKVRRSEISEIMQPFKRLEHDEFHHSLCIVIMKNGNRYNVLMPYEKAAELV